MQWCSMSDAPKIAVTRAAGALHKFDFSDQLVLITGAAGGIGTAAAKGFLEAGARVVGLDRIVTSTGFPTIVADLTDPDAVAAAFQQIDAEYGSPDVIVNSAGIREVKAAIELSPAEWNRVVDVNLNATFYVIREAAIRMRQKNFGSIVSVASVAGLVGIPHRPAYNATKHAIIGLSRNLAADLAPCGIRVNVVAPGTVRTALTEAYYADPEFLEDLEKTVPLGAQGTVDDIVTAILFLASPHTGFITGTVLPVDGGFTATKSYSYGSSTAYTDASSGSF